MKKIFYSIYLFFMIVPCLIAQTTLQTVDFEIDGSGYSITPSESNANTNNPDYWIRTNGTTPVVYHSNPITNVQGSYYFTGEDLDFDSGATPFILTCNAIDVSGYESIQIKLLVAGAGINYNKEGEEYFKIEYQYDGGGFNLLAQFLGNGNYYTEDANGDGTVDGADVVTAMQEFTYNIPSSGTNLQVRFHMYNGGSEEFAFDNIRISGTEIPAPVELTSFTAAVSDGKVKLNWQTATEVNNYGFDIESSPAPSKNNYAAATWQKIAFVEGAGNSNSPKEYSYTDESNQNGTVQYRLKQIDIDGKFEYSNIADVTISTLPNKFELRQNYPNPFNPATVIRYSIPSVAAPSTVEGQQHVTLKVYDILGNEVATLVNENQEAGNYEIEFNGINLASGIYLYRLQTSSGFVSTKKLMLLK